MDVQVAHEAALQSALISGFDPRVESDEKYQMHQSVMEQILACKTGALTHPLIINMTLCEHREPKYRRGIRAAEAGFLPDAKYVKRLLFIRWMLVERAVPQMRTENEEDREKFCWEQHDFFLCLEPFIRANSRTARIIYYMLATSLKVPVKVIRAEKAGIYYRNSEEYRKSIFAPDMRARGYIAS